MLNLTYLCILLFIFYQFTIPEFILCHHMSHQIKAILRKFISDKTLQTYLNFSNNNQHEIVQNTALGLWGKTIAQFQDMFKKTTMNAS